MRLNWCLALLGAALALFALCGDVRAGDAELKMPDADGFWVLEKTAVHGVGPTDTELAGFLRRFDGMAFEVRDGWLFFNDGSASYYEPRQTTVRQFFDKALDAAENEALFKEYFRNAFGVELNDDLTVWTLPFCAELSVDVLVLPDRLFGVDEGLFYGAYKRVDLRAYLRAAALEEESDFSYNIDGGWAEQYVYANAGLDAAYARTRERYLEIAWLLYEKIPRNYLGSRVLTSREIETSGGKARVDVIYHFLNARQFGIVLTYPDHEERLTFVEDGDLVLVRMLRIDNLLIESEVGG